MLKQESPIDSKQHLINGAEKIHKDAKFSSFYEFEKAFDEWKQLFNHPFRVASSERQEDAEMAARFRYRYVVYHCSRYGEPRKRGAGRRPHQNYLPCGCNAKLRLNYQQQNGGSLLITTLVTEHNHLSPNEENNEGGNENFEIKKIKNSPGSAHRSYEEDLNNSNNISQFSPLNLQTTNIVLHNSPSSGGQSSLEGEILGINQQKTSPNDLKSLIYKNLNFNEKRIDLKNDGGLSAAFALNLALKASLNAVTNCPQNSIKTEYTSNNNIPLLQPNNRQTNNNNNNNNQIFNLLRLCSPSNNNNNNNSLNNNNQLLLPLLQQLIKNSTTAPLLPQLPQLPSPSVTTKQQTGSASNSASSIFSSVQHPIIVQTLQRKLELNGNNLIKSEGTKNNNNLTGVTDWLNQSVELQRLTAEIDKKRNQEHSKVHNQWIERIANLEKEMRDKKTAIEQEFHQRINLLEEWRRMQDLNIEREWNQNRSALESSELINKIFKENNKEKK